MNNKNNNKQKFSITVKPIKHYWSEDIEEDKLYHEVNNVQCLNVDEAEFSWSDDYELTIVYTI